MSNHRSDLPSSSPPHLLATDVRRRRPVGRAFVGVIVGALLLTGCGRGGDDVSADATTSTSVRSPAASTAPTTSDGDSGTGGADRTPTSEAANPAAAALTGASTSPSSAEPSNPAMEPAELTRVRLGSHDGYERIVFEFQGELPGYEVRYLDSEPAEDGSGDAVDVRGSEFLSVRIHPASGYRMTDDGYETIYTGPKRITGAGAPILELVRTGDFEAQSTWTAGLDRQRPFVVSTLSSPPRIVVDVAA